MALVVTKSSERCDLPLRLPTRIPQLDGTVLKYTRYRVVPEQRVVPSRSCAQLLPARSTTVVRLDRSTSCEALKDAVGKRTRYRICGQEVIEPAVKVAVRHLLRTVADSAQTRATTVKIQHGGVCVPPVPTCKDLVVSKRTRYRVVPEVLSRAVVPNAKVGFHPSWSTGR